MKIYTGIGSRETPDDILIVMTKIASKLKERGFLLRSGGAKGADSAFEAGAGDYKEIWTPNHTLPRWAWDAASGVCLECPLDKMKPHIQKLIVRNMLQIMGKEGTSPTNFVVLWTKELDSTDPKCGGTRYAARYAKNMGIEILNLKDEAVLRNICSLLGLQFSDKMIVTDKPRIKMGTAAVFGIVPKGKTIPQTEYTNPIIIGMTSDGFPDNLEHLAKRFVYINKIKFPNQELDNEMIVSILEDVVREDSNWLFVDKLNNSSWVTYYGWLKLDDMNLHVEKYNDEDFSKVIKIS